VTPEVPSSPDHSVILWFKMMPKCAFRDIGVRELVTYVPSTAVAASAGVINCQAWCRIGGFDAQATTTRWHEEPGAQSNNHRCHHTGCPWVRQDPPVSQELPSGATAPGLVHIPARPAERSFPKQQLPTVFIMLVTTTTAIYYFLFIV